jgi:hypothetical protein
MLHRTKYLLQCHGIKIFRLIGPWHCYHSSEVYSPPSRYGLGPVHVGYNGHSATGIGFLPRTSILLLSVSFKQCLMLIFDIS